MLPLSINTGMPVRDVYSMRNERSSVTENGTGKQLFSARQKRKMRIAI